MLTSCCLLSRPNEIGRVIKAGIKANRYIRQNRDGTLTIMAQWLKIDKEMTARTYDSSVKTFGENFAVPEDGLRLLIDDAKPIVKVNREVPLSDVAGSSGSQIGAAGAGKQVIARVS